MAVSKTFRAKVRDGRLEPLEPVELKEGEELEVTVADEANEWFKELHMLFAPVRKELVKESEATIDRRIARAVKAVRARKRGET